MRQPNCLKPKRSPSKGRIANQSSGGRDHCSRQYQIVIRTRYTQQRHGKLHLQPDRRYLCQHTSSRLYDWPGRRGEDHHPLQTEVERGRHDDPNHRLQRG